MFDSGLLNIALPNTEEEILLWSQMICLWMLINYVFGSDPPSEGNTIQKQKTFSRLIAYKILIYDLIIFFLPGFNLKKFGHRILVVLIFTILLMILPLVRDRLTRSQRKVLNRKTAEWELITNALLIISLGYVIAKGSIEIDPATSLFVFPVSAAHLSICFLTLAAAAFLCDGGTRVTRGILFKTGTAPQKTFTKDSVTDPAVTINTEQDSSLVDNKEFNRGKYIGNLERLMVLAVVLVGSYETIGFIIAGKGLIRAKEFEHRDFAEYFLIGTLTSVAIAIAVGLLMKLAIQNIMS